MPVYPEAVSEVHSQICHHHRQHRHVSIVKITTFRHAYTICDVDLAYKEPCTVLSSIHKEWRTDPAIRFVRNLECPGP